MPGGVFGDVRCCVWRCGGAAVCVCGRCYVLLPRRGRALAVPLAVALALALALALHFSRACACVRARVCIGIMCVGILFMFPSLG